MLNVIIFFLLSLSYHRFFYKKKTTASSIVVAYLGRFNSQFNEFRAFKVLFFSSCSYVDVCSSSFLTFCFTDCGHLRISINYARKHHDNKHFGVVFVSSL